MQGIAIENLEAFKKDYTFNDQQKQEITRYKDTKEGLVTALKLEYWAGKNEIDNLASRAGFNLYNKMTLKPHSTANLITNQYLDLISYIQSDCSNIKPEAREDVVASEQKINYFEPNWKGKAIVNMISVNLTSVKGKECAKQARIEAFIK